MSDNITERLKKIVAEQIGVQEDEIQENSSFEDDLGADSLTIVELIMAVEEEFGIEIPDEDSANLKTFGAVKDYIVNKSN